MSSVSSVSVACSGWWVVLSFVSDGGGVLGTTDDWADSCDSMPGVLIGGVGFGEGAGVLLQCPWSVGIGFRGPVLTPWLCGDLLRDGGV